MDLFIAVVRPPPSNPVDTPLTDACRRLGNITGMNEADGAELLAHFEQTNLKR